jgi:cyclopropane fatty-acyl-phospholipid synthase-like methyltransferase
MNNDRPTATKTQVEDFYNTFKEHQKKLGINIRHRTIFKNLKQAGLTPASNVLEVGCGIGTVSSLILKFLSTGKFVGADISSESIALAKKMCAGYKHAEFIVSDMSSFTHALRFDFVVLPDVLEHIPVDQHSNLFRVLSTVTTADAVVLINIPEPNCLDWIREHHPETLQIIDQSLSMQEILNNAYPHGFKLFSMNSYSLQYREPDYTSIVLKRNMKPEKYNLKNKLRLGTENVMSKLS